MQRQPNYRRECIKKLREALENGQLVGPARKFANIRSASTLFVWNQQCHGRLYQLMDRARDKGQEKRNEIVEDAQFKKLAAGTASGNEYEFYLCNRMPDRWKKLKDNTVVVQNTINNEAQQSGNGTFDGEDAQLTESIRAKLFPNIPAK